MTDQSDLLVIEKVLQGDTAVYAVLVERYRNMAFTLAYHIILNREDAEELVQDSFVKAFASLWSFKRNSKFSTWLYRIIVNTTLNKQRLKKLNMVDMDATADEDFGSVASEPLFNFTRDEQRKYIRLAIQSLGENERLCITLYYLNELSVEEVNQLTGISISNIKVLLHRGRKKIYSELKALLKDEMKNLI